MYRFPTTKKQDKIILLTAMEDLPSRKYFAILYRMEMKRIVSHQIKLGKIILLILQRLLSGRMDLEMACSRVFELEKKTGNGVYIYIYIYIYRCCNK